MKPTVLVIGFDTRACDLSSSLARRLMMYADAADMRVYVLVPGDVAKTVQENNYTAESVSVGKKILTAYRLLRRAWELVFDPRVHVRVMSTRDPYYLGFALSLIARFAHVGFEVQLHGLERRNRLRLFIARFTLRRATSIRVVTHRFRDELIAQFHIDKSRFFVAPVPVDVAAVTALAGESPLLKYRKHGVVLGVGRLVTGKRFDVLVRAWAALKKEGNTSHLVLVGEGPEDQRLLGLAHALGFGSDFHLEGQQHDVRPYFHGADIVVHPTAHEGYGLVPIEAALNGVPLLMTDTGVAREVVPEGDKVHLIAPNDDVALTSELRAFFRGEWGKGRSAKPFVSAHVYSLEATAHEIGKAWQKSAGVQGTEKIKDYYNSLVGEAYHGDYERERWFQTPLMRDRFVMMEHAIVHAFYRVIPKHIFEFGPGPGTWTALLANHFPRASFHLLDISSTMREQFFKKRGELKGVEYELGDILEYRTQERFDTVFSSRAIEYVPDKQKVIAKLLEIMSPGGTGVLITKTPHYLKKKLLRQDTPWQHREQIHPLALKQLIEKCGGTNVTVSIAVAYVPFIGRMRVINRWSYGILARLPWSPLSSALSEAYLIRFQKPYAR